MIAGTPDAETGAARTRPVGMLHGAGAECSGLMEAIAVL